MASESNKDSVFISELFFRWSTGRYPDYTFADYIESTVELEEENFDWETISNELEMDQDFLKTVPFEEARKMSAEEMENWTSKDA